jgi:hypothetical protein
MSQTTDLRPTLKNIFLNGEIHNWYQLVTGYSGELVAGIIDEFNIHPGQKVIDPFCGAGTTLIECKKRGIESLGIDANPSSCFASKVKTNWNLKGEHLRELVDELSKVQSNYLRRTKAYKNDPTYEYLESSGMIKRGWISHEPLKKAIAIKSSINSLPTSKSYRNALLLALIAEVVSKSSNVKFGPELYCGPHKTDSNVFKGFNKRVNRIADDLDLVSEISDKNVKVIQGDSRNCVDLLNKIDPGPYSFIISSPPYPTEHDYTRNSRLELAFLEDVSDKKTLQLIKRKMIRSHTKGIYKGDNDSVFIQENPEIIKIVNEINKRVILKTHGFARLYSKVIQEYFGGMMRHLINIYQLLEPGAKCAYIIGDQASYLQVYISTAKILSSIANEIGYETIEIRRLRMRRSTITSREIEENILILKKRNQGEIKNVKN